MRLTLTLTKKQIEALRHWHEKSADFGDVEFETGYDLVALIYTLARKATKEDRTRTYQARRAAKRKKNPKPLPENYEPYEPKGSPY